MNVCILVHSELVSESLWSFARLRAGVSPCRAFTCIHVHLHYIHVSRCIHVHSTCIRVHSCASACISCVHPCAFMCIHVHPRACAFYVHSRALVCIHVHYLGILVYSCAFVCIYLHRNCVHSCASLCINSAFIAIHMTCLHVQSCPTWQELATRCNVSAAFNARTFDQAQRPARARAFCMHLTCIYAHLNHVKECIYNAGKCIVNVMRLRREARVCGGLIAFVHSTCNARECA